MLSRSNTLPPSKEAALVGMMIAILEVGKVALMFLPNIEVVTLFLIVFSVAFGRETWFAVAGFVLIEGILFGFGIWWVMYIYIWPSLVAIAKLFRKKGGLMFWAILAAAYGLTFGFFCSIPYLFMGGLKTAISWWIAGIPYDLIHGVSNFAITLVLFKPLYRVTEKLSSRLYGKKSDTPAEL